MSLRDFLEGTLWALGMICCTLGGLGWLYMQKAYRKTTAEYRRMIEELENLLERMRLATEEGEKLVKEARECKSHPSI